MKIYSFIYKYQFIFFIIIAIYLTLENNLFLNSLFQEEYIKEKKKVRNIPKKNFDSLISLYIENTKTFFPEICGEYVLFNNDLYNDACIFKHINNDFWIFKSRECVDDVVYFYWIISPNPPSNNTDKIIKYYHTILESNILNNPVYQYVDYGMFPEGMFVNVSDINDVVDVNLLD